MTPLPKAFLYKDQLYIRITPCKRLFNSTTVWEVVNRGDFFALNLATKTFTVISSKAEIEAVDLTLLIKSSSGIPF
jgi:hypothetical protein